MVSIALSLAVMVPVVYAIKSVAKGGMTLTAAGLLLLGLAAGALFVRRQLRRPQPMLDVRLFRQSAFTGSVLANLLSIFSLVGFLFFISQYLQLVAGQGPMQAGISLLPGLIVTMVAGLAMVPLVRRVGPRVIITGGLLISAAGYGAVVFGAVVFGAVVFGAQQGSTAALLLAFVLLSLGIGAAETISNDVILSSVPADRAAAASAISETAYELGAVLGTAVLGGILTATYSAQVVLPTGLTVTAAASATETLGGATAVASSLPAPQAAELLASAQQAFGSGVGITSAIAAAVMLGAAAMVWFALRSTRAEV